jgi:hypothetical protein
VGCGAAPVTAVPTTPSLPGAPHSGYVPRDEWSCGIRASRFLVAASEAMESDCSDRMEDLASIPRAIHLRPDEAPESKLVPSYYFETCYLTLFEDTGRDCEAHIGCYTEFGWIPHGRYYVIERYLTIDLLDPEAPIDYIQQFTWMGRNNAELCTTHTEVLLNAAP